MLKFHKNTDQELQSLLHNSFSGRLRFSNYYGFELVNLEYHHSAETLLIKKTFLGFSRLYILSNNENELISLLTQLGPNYVINIPSKKGINDWGVILAKAGFKPFSTFKRYFYSSIKKRGEFKKSFACLADISSIKGLLLQHFSPITGHLPDDKKLSEMIENKQILVNRNKSTDVVEGVIGFSIEKTKCYIPFWVDLSGFGLSLLFNLFNLLIDNEIGYVYFWINDENTETIGIHAKLGAKPDGLADYVFLK